MEVKGEKIVLTPKEQNDLSKILKRTLTSHRYKPYFVNQWLRLFDEFGLNSSPSIINHLTWTETNRGFNACYFMQLNWLYHVIRYIKVNGEWHYGNKLYSKLVDKFREALSQAAHLCTFEHDGKDKLIINKRDFDVRKEYYFNIYKKITKNFDF